jgi:hypothetical protein
MEAAGLEPAHHKPRRYLVYLPAGLPPWSPVSPVPRVTLSVCNLNQIIPKLTCTSSVHSWPACLLPSHPMPTRTALLALEA